MRAFAERSRNSGASRKAPSVRKDSEDASKTSRTPAEDMEQVSRPKYSYDLSRVRVFGSADRFAGAFTGRVGPGLAAGNRNLPIGAAGSALEQEADRAAERATGGFAPRLPLAEVGTRSAQASLSSPLADGGQPLERTVRGAIEAALGADLGGVRVHTGSDAARWTANIGARAFTHGQHIFLSERESPGDLRLLAHESVHTLQQASGAFYGIQRQPAGGIAVHIKIGDSTRLNKDFKWHYDSLPDKLKNQLTKEIKEAFSFLPKEFPVTVDWGQFKDGDLKKGGNIQVWLVPQDSPELIGPVMQKYGYKEEVIKANLKDLSDVKPNEEDRDNPRRRAVGGTPKETADPKTDPITSRPVIVTVPGELWTELDPTAVGAEKHRKDTASRGIDQLAYTAEHEIGHDVGLEHDAGNFGPKSKSGNFEQSFPPDIMDEVRPFFLDEYADAPNYELTEEELKKLGGENKVRENPVVEKVEVDPKTHEAKVWIDLKKIKYSKDEQGSIQSNLKNLALFVDSMKNVKKETKKDEKKDEKKEEKKTK